MKKYRVLFIGNSYTYFNDMPKAIFEVIAKEAGVDAEVESVVKGGWTLERHADPEGETGALVAQKLAGEPYDYVILQEQSLYPATEPERFMSAVRDLVSRIKATGAKPVLYSTWGRKTGSTKLADINMTNESMTYAVARSYRDIGAELGIPVAHVGLAFYDIGDRIELYDPDKTHPSREGSYLAALCLFIRIFGDREQFVTCDIPEETALLLQNAARKAVLDTPTF